MKRILAATAATLVALLALSMGPAAASPHTDHLRHVAHLRHVLAMSTHQSLPGGGSGGPIVYQEPRDHGRHHGRVLCFGTSWMTPQACAAFWATWNAANQ